MNWGGDWGGCDGQYYGICILPYFHASSRGLTPPNAWDSLDQTLIVVSKLSAEMAEKVSEAGKATFMTGVSATLIGTTIITIVVFVSMAVYARNKRP